MAYSLAKNDPEAVLPQKILTSSDFSISDLKSYFSRDAINVVVVPSYKSETFINAVLRELSAMLDLVESKNNYEFIVVGMPQWRYYERVNFEYYENLKLHIPDDYYVDRDRSANIKFRNGYRSNYGIAPREFAYVGFDLTLYFGRLLKKYGTAFPDKFDEATATGRHTQFYFEPMVRMRNILDGSKTVEDIEIMRFENQFVNKNSGVEGIAESLATYYLLYGDVNLINKEIEIYRSITREDIQKVAKKYLSPSQRVEIEYLPKKEEQ
jgi:hypothetical protein